YSNFHLLPWYVTILLGFYMGLLGDFFVSLHDPERPAGTRNILFFVVIPMLCCCIGYIVLSPEFGAIKRMNFIYFAYCLMITYMIVSVLTAMSRIRLMVPVNAMLEILGRYSLTLYIVHFFMGYSMEKFVLSPFVPQKFWFLNSIAVLTGCVLMALFFELVNRRSAAGK
ncbi:MAG: hypothetical protein Q7U02_13155, partial [Desulfosalsimonadaceae bacterium]|nr:hypothetical protein [Desulfosalsimonadaceae bacterium]